MEILLLIGLIVLNGLFAMSEIALVTARRARLAKRAEEGEAAAAIAIELGEDPNRFLSTIQIGITSIGILSGIVGEAALARPLALWLQDLGVETTSSEYGAMVLVVVVITYTSIVIGELVPKRIGQINPEDIALLVARPMRLLATLSRPFVLLLSNSTSLLLRLLGQSEVAGPSVTEEEIHALLVEGSEAGVIEKSEHTMVRNVFRLDDRQIASLMVPRSELVYLDIDRPLDENLALITASAHARFPVCQGGLEEILGVLDVRQLLGTTLRGDTPNLIEHLQDPVYVPESLTCMELLDQFRTTNTHLVIVVDEYGEVQGIVTLQDLIESVTGEFFQTNTEDSWAIQREDGSWLLDGLIPLPELKDTLGLKMVPEEEKGRYNTLSGMLMLLFGRLAETGDRLTWEGWLLEVIDLDGKRIDKVLATRIPETQDEESSAQAMASS